MRFTNILFTVGIGVTSMHLAGCASPPADLANGVPWVSQQYDAIDARVQRVEDRPYLRFDTVGVSEMNLVQENSTLESSRTLLLEALDRSHMLSLQVTRTELDRLNDEGWQRLNKEYFEVDEVPDNDKRRTIWNTYQEETNTQYKKLCDAINSCQAKADLKAISAEIQDDILPSIKTRGRLVRSLPLLVIAPFVNAVVDDIYESEIRGELDRHFETARKYYPEYKNESIKDWDLLTKYAPIIVQEELPEASYKQSIDKIGVVVATDETHIEIDTTRSAVYAYARSVPIKGLWHTQLVYTHWYQEAATIDGSSSMENGLIEGLTLRLTLDTNNEPLIFETLDSCGCYHRAYPMKNLEIAANEQFGKPMQDKDSVIEQCVKGRHDLIVTRVIDEPISQIHPVVRCVAANHTIIDVDFTYRGHESEINQQTPYSLLPYEQLERIELTNGSYTSMFDADGLVRGAVRDEGFLLSSLGMLSAGQPRQRGTQLIHFNEWDFDDPELFEKSLRWPDLNKTKTTDASLRR